MAARHFLFIVASARIPGAIGNTEWLAREAARHLPAGHFAPSDMPAVLPR